MNDIDVWFMVYTDPQPAYADVEAGNLDSMDTVPTSALSTFESDDQVQAVNEPGNVSQSFTFAANQKHFSLDDEGRLRRAAVSMAIDREQIIDKVSNGTNTPAVDFTAPLIPGYSESVPGNEVLQYNPDKANTESSDDAAKQDYQQAQEILFKDLPAVPLWYANNKGVAAKNVKGFTLTWQGIEDYRNMTKE